MHTCIYIRGCGFVLQQMTEVQINRFFLKKKQDSDECVGVCTEHVYAHVTFGKYFHQNSSSISTVNAHVVEYEMFSSKKK